MKGKQRETMDALEILEDVTGDDPELREAIEQATLNAQVAELVYAARHQAGLTQRQLAARIGSTQPVIARLERADYEGHSLTMLRRIGEALGLRLEVRFVSAGERLPGVEQPVARERRERLSGTASRPRRGSR